MSKGKASRKAGGGMAWIAALATAAGLACALLAGPAAAQGRPDRPSPVIVFETSLVPFAERIEALGTLRANETVALTPPVADTITAINFDDGARVEAGFVLAEMTSAEEQAALSEARSTVAESRSQYQRARDLAERGSATQATLDQRRRDYDTALARLRATQSRLQDRLIIAPFDGVVGLRTVSVGSYVSAGDVITTLYDDAIMKLDFSLPETYLAAIAVGQVVEAAASSMPSEVFEGEIASLGAAIDPVTRSIPVRALIPNEDRRLRPGMLMRVEILRDERQAIVIPETAVIVEGRDTFVWIVGAEGLAERRSIQLGARQPGQVEVTGGLEVGEQVVTHGGSNLRPGALLQIRAVETGTESLVDLLSQSSTQEQ